MNRNDIISFSCPRCAASLSVSADLPRAKCPYCDGLVSPPAELLEAVNKHKAETMQVAIREAEKAKIEIEKARVAAEAETRRMEIKETEKAKIELQKAKSKSERAEHIIGGITSVSVLIRTIRNTITAIIILILVIVFLFFFF